MKTMYVYILECADGSYYTGVTNNIERRLFEHQFGRNETAYTFSRRPVYLAWLTVCKSPMEAIRLEKQIKGWTRVKKEALIFNEIRLLRSLAKKKNFGKKRRS